MELGLGLGFGRQVRPRMQEEQVRSALLDDGVLRVGLCRLGHGHLAPGCGDDLGARGAALRDGKQCSTPLRLGLGLGLGLGLRLGLGSGFGLGFGLRLGLGLGVALAVRPGLG